MTKFSTDAEYQRSLRESGEIRLHVAIIMDGNGRWARRRGMPRVAGHQAGVDSVRDIVEACGQLGVKYLTLFAFSTENWKRPQGEVSTLMRLLLHYLRAEAHELNRQGVRLMSIGQTNFLPDEVQAELVECTKLLQNNNGLTLNLALSYGARWDMVRAVRTLALDIRSGKLSPEDIDEERVSSYLSTASIPDPDLLVRTSGEMRVSNFLLWEIAYAELVVTSAMWPDFRRKHLYDAIYDYQRRERRFGMTGEQVSPRAKKEGYLQRLLHVFTRTHA